MDFCFALINLRLSDGTLVQIDPRPSDAIALAVRIKYVIYTYKDVICSKGMELKNEKNGKK